MKLFVALYLYIFVMCNGPCNHPDKVKVKYYPFRMHSSIPISESILDKAKLSNLGILKEKSINSPKAINEIAHLLDEICRGAIMKDNDPDFRMAIYIYGKGNLTSYYVNWDKKYIEFDNKFYQVSKKQLSSLLRNLNVENL